MSIRIAALLASCLCSSAVLAAELKLQINDLAGKPVENAALWLKPASGAAPAPHSAPAHVTIDQVERNFKPLLSVIRAGTLVDFPNSDNIRHSVYSFSASKVFTLKLYSGKPSEPVLFDKEGFVTLGCNIHDQMIAWVVVVDSPWFAHSASNGAAHIGGLAEGDYVLNAWHPGLGSNLPVTQKVHVDSSATTRTLQLAAAPIATLLPDTEGQVHGSKEH